MVATEGEGPPPVGQHRADACFDPGPRVGGRGKREIARVTQAVRAGEIDELFAPGV
jgi:hypothetical protein